MTRVLQDPGSRPGPDASGADTSARRSGPLPARVAGLEVMPYLDALHRHAPQGTFIEVRYRVAGGMRQRFHPADDRIGVAQDVLRYGRTTDVYVGVLPRARRRGGRRDIADGASVVWADCDSPESVDALRGFTPRPSVLVASGRPGHRHAYWCLHEHCDLDRIEEANRSLALALHADLASTDAARILRPPSSLNHRVHPAAPVRLLVCDPERRHRLGELLLSCPDRPAGAANARGSGRRLHDDPLLELPPQLYVETLTGLRVSRDRKVRCPFHDDAEPSLHVYPRPEQGWYCFGCRRGGSVYDFAALLWGVPPRGEGFLQLRERLDEVLAPAVELGREPE